MPLDSGIVMTVIDTPRGSIEYVEVGDGPPILYFHGTGITCDGMIPIEEPLADSGFRLIIFNRPGYGATPIAEHRSAAACSSVAASLMDALNIDSACVMGSSGGAAFATSFAIQHPERTDCLVLLCPQLHRWSDKRWLPVQSRWTLPLLKNRLLRKILLKLYAIHFPRMTVDQFMKMESGSRYDTVRDNDSVRELCRNSLTAMAKGPRYPGFENDFIVFTTEDIITHADQLQVPMMVLHDRHDPMAPLAHVEWFTSIVPDCKCVSIHTAGHLVWAGPEASVMHDARVQFMTQHAKYAA